MELFFLLKLLNNFFQIGAYFSMTIWSLVYALRQVDWLRSSISRLCLLVALVALAITWFFIVSFVVDDLYAPQYAALDWQHYLVESKRFVKCYVAVSSDSAQRWVWSSQLLFAVHALIVALFVDGTRRGLARSLWKYVCLGFFCAISVALPLFIARSNIADYGVAARRRPRTMSPSRLRSLSPSRLRATHQRRDDDGEGDGAAMAAATTPPITGWFFLCILAGLVSTYLTPFLSSSTYSFNLMFVHVVLLLPFLVDALNRGAANQHESARVVRVALLYAMIGGASAIAHVSSLVRALSLSTDFKQLLIAPLEHDCASSIAVDMVIVSLIGIALFIASAKEHPTVSWFCVLATPFVSIGATLSLFLACREIRRVHQLVSKQQ